MKHLLLPIIFAAFASTSIAQVNPNPPGIDQPKCGIWFDYDAAGNRIKRYYDCKSTLPGQDEQGFPNPFMTSNGGEDDDSLAARKANNPNSTNISTDGKFAAQPTVYPNPTKGKFTIALPAQEKTHYHLYNSQGAIVQSGYLTDLKNDLNISSLANATYTLSVYYEDKQYTFRLVKVE